MQAFDPQMIGEKAVEIFTDREAPRAAFWSIYNSLQENDIEVINYYGIGGIGKSSLLKQLQKELKEKGNTRFIEYSFENKKQKDMVLYDMSRQLMAKCKGLQFPIFDYAFEKYHALIGEKHLGKQLLEKENVLNHHLVGSTVSVVGQFVPFVGPASTVISESAKAISAISKKYEQLMGANSRFYKEISETDSAQILFRNLQRYFAIDAYIYFKDHQDKPLVVMLDGYEVFVNRLEKGDKAKSDDLWLREAGSLVMSIPRTIWVIAGREKLDWDESMLPQNHTHLIGDLSETDAEDFFVSSGIEDKNLAKELYDLTKGTPVYMDLCIKQYRNLCRTNPFYQPSIDDFGKNTEEIAIRFLRDMTIVEQGMLYLLSCMPNAWSDVYVQKLAESLHYDFSQNEYRLIKEMTLVEAIDAADQRYRLHETFRNIIFHQIKEDERIRILKGVKDIYVTEVATSHLRQSEFQYLFMSLMEILNKHYEVLECSAEDIRKVTWAAFKHCISCGTDFFYFDQLESMILKNENQDSVRNYVRCEEMYIRTLSYFDRDQEALEKAKEVYDKMTALGKDDTEGMRVAEYLYGWQLFMTDQYAESLKVLAEACKKLDDTRDVSYECKKNIYNNYGQVLYTYAEDIEAHNQVMLQWLLACDEEIRARELAYGAYSRKANRIRQDKADVYLKLDQEEETLKLQKEIYEAMKGQYQENDIRLCNYKFDIAQTYWHLGEYQSALSLLFEMEGIYQMNQADEEEYISLYGEIRDCYFQLEEYNQAYDYGSKVVDLEEQVSGKNFSARATELQYLADICRMQGNYEEAIEKMKEAADITELIFGPNHSETLTAYKYMTYVYDDIGDREKSHEIWEDLQKKYQELYGDTHQKTLMASFRLGDLAYHNKEYDVAKAIKEPVYEMLCEKALFDENEKMDAAKQLMFCCKNLEDYEGLKKYCLELLPYLFSNMDIFEDRYWYTYELLGDAYRELEEPSKAIDIHNEILKHYEEAGDIEDILAARLSVSIDLEAAEDYEKVYEFDKESYALVVDHFGEDSEEAKDYAEYLADDLEALNQSKDAE